MAKKTRAAKPIRIKHIIAAGELGRDARDTNQLIAAAAGLLDDCEASEILGQVLFEGEDGKFYTMTVEAIIGEASKGFVKDVLQEIEREKDAPENETM